MRAEIVVAIINPDLQDDLVATLHARNAGHLARVVRRDRGGIAAQMGRAGIVPDLAPGAVVLADRILIVTAAHRSAEIGWLLLQRGATSVWIVSPEEEWAILDDVPIDIAATADLPARPLLPAHRSERTFRVSKHRRRSRHAPVQPEPNPKQRRPEASSRS